MLIINPGMQKSGTAYIYNLINELLVVSGGEDARDIKEKYNLARMMRHHNNNIGRLAFQKLLRLWYISTHEGPFVVKTHNGPSLSTRLLNALGLVKIIYIYRDPRDVILSALDHGKKIREAGETHTFAQFTDIETAVKHAEDWISVWGKYNNMSGILMVKYEELLSNTEKVLSDIAKHLGINSKQYKKALADIIWKYNATNAKGDKQGLHCKRTINRALAQQFPI